MGGDFVIQFSIIAGTVCGLKLYKNLGEQLRKANAYWNKNKKGELKFCSLKFTSFVGSCAINTNCISWSRSKYWR